MPASSLPVNVDATYADSGTDATVALHQQHHDALHARIASQPPAMLGLQAAGQPLPAALPSVALRPFFASLANRHYARCNIVVVGDSITEGQGATVESRRWIRRAEAVLRSLNPTLGNPTGGRGFIGANSSGSTSFTWPVTLANSPGTNTDYGPKRNATTLTATGMTASFALNGTSCDIMYPVGAVTGQMSYKVDAAGAVNITATTAGTPADATLLRVSLGTAGAHTLLISWVSGSNVLDGVIEYNGDESAGIQFHDGGHFGWRTDYWSNPQTGPGYWPKAIAALSPAAIIICLGNNDITASAPAITAANLTTNLQSMIAAMKAATGFVAGTPFILLPTAARQSYKTSTPPWSDYVTAMYSVAAADATVAVCDLSTRVPNFDDTASLSVYADAVHPTDKGHAWYGDIVAAFLTQG